MTMIHPEASPWLMSMVLGMIWISASRAPTLVHITGIGVPSNFQKEGQNRSPPMAWLFGRQGGRTLSAGPGGAGSSAPEYGLVRMWCSS